jgi:predicted acetyltransferase
LGIVDLHELKEIKDNMHNFFGDLFWRNNFGATKTPEYHASKMKRAVKEISNKVMEYYSIDQGVKELFIDQNFLQQKAGHKSTNKTFCPIYSVINQIETVPFDYTVAPDYKFYNAF